MTSVTSAMRKLDPLIDKKINRAIARSGIRGGTTSGGGGSGSGGGGSDLAAHIAQDYATAHPTNDATINDRRVYHAHNFGLTFNGTTDDSNAILTMLDTIGLAGGGIVDFASPNTTGSIYLAKLVSLYYSNVELRFNPHTPLIYGAAGGLRIMGEYAEFTRIPGGIAGKLTTNSTEVSDKLTLTLVSGQGAYFSANDRIVIRGQNDVTGKALQKQETYIESIAGDVITCKDGLADGTSHFQPTYPGSEWPADATTGTTIYVITGSLSASNISTGAFTVTVADASNFAVGDLVVISDNRTEIDMNASAISGSGNPYRNPANLEIARVTAVDTGTDVVTFDRALCRSYLTANYAGVWKLLPVRNSSISGARISYNATQTSRSINSLQITYAEDCHIYDCIVDGRGGRYSQALRLSYAYNCSAHNNAIRDAAVTTSGGGYGITDYYSTLSRIYDNVIAGCRHSILIQLSTLCDIYGNESRDDKISGIDTHGVYSKNCHIHHNRVTRSNGNTADSSNGSGIRIGNTSHTGGDHGIVIEDNFISGYLTGDGTESAIDVIPASTGIVVRNNTIIDCSDGFRFTKNSAHVTPTQTASNIMIEGNHLVRCTVPFNVDGASTGFIANLTVKNNVSDGNAGGHFRFIDVDGFLVCENNSVINPVNTSGVYAFYFDNCDALICAENVINGANRGIYLNNCVSAQVTGNVMRALIDGYALTDNGGNTGLLWLPPRRLTQAVAALSGGATVTTLFAIGTALPTTADGAGIISFDYTPLYPGAPILIKAFIPYGSVSAADNVAAAIFTTENATTTCRGVGVGRYTSGATSGEQIAVSCKQFNSAASTTAMTILLHVGPKTAGTTLTLNGQFNASGSLAQPWLEIIE